MVLNSRQCSLYASRLLPPHILPKQQDVIAVFELTIEAVANAQDGAIDHDLDVLPQLTGCGIPERTLQLGRRCALKPEWG